MDASAQAVTPQTEFALLDRDPLPLDPLDEVPLNEEGVAAASDDEIFLAEADIESSASATSVETPGVNTGGPHSEPSGEVNA
jgi:hypothetical protein